MKLAHIPYTTKPCCICGKTSVVMLDSEAYDKWRRGMLVQLAFPDMSTDNRELLISGTHPACWNKLFKDCD